MKRVILAALLIGVCLQGILAGQQAGQNIAVLPVVTPTDPADPASVLDAALKGDLYLNRQVEPTIAVSTRNPNTLLAFYINYGAVEIQTDTGLGESRSSLGALAWNFVKRIFATLAGRKPVTGPGIPAAATAVEAWVGGSRSYDGGVTWTGLYLPGAPFDNSPASMASPIKGLEAATDPVLVAGPCGKFYLAFLAFTRLGASKMVVARYEDLNNELGGDTVVYTGMTVLESANNGQWGYFLDKPSAAVDVLRTVSSDPCAHTVYVAYTTFNGQEQDGKFKSKITFARSTDAGISFSTQKLNMPYQQNQSTAIAVDPRDGSPATTGGGTVYIAWRHFFNPNTILLHKSTNYGQTFPGQPVDLLAASTVPLLQTFDQPTISTENSTNPSAEVTFRTNSVPTLVANASGTLFAAWQERVDVTPASPTFGFPTGDANATVSPRIVLTRSQAPMNAMSWTPRQAVDVADRDPSAPQPIGFGLLPQSRPSGPQVMPRLASGGGRLLLTYFESRGFMQQAPGEQIILSDVTPPAPGFIAGIDRVMDFRAAVLNATTGALLGTSQVSRYPLKAEADLEDGSEDLADIVPSNAPCLPDDPSGTEPCVRRVNHPNDPHSAAGTSPFIGDYNDTVAAVQFVPKADQSGWRWANAPADVPHSGFHTVWADNRNLIRPTFPAASPLYDRYKFYSPPIGGTICTNPGSRNTDVLTSNVNADLVVSAPISFKQLENVQRAFPVYAHNGTSIERYFRLSFQTQAMADRASFDQFDPLVDTLDVLLFPFSSATRVAYVPPSDANLPLTVLVQETVTLGGALKQPDGLSGTVTMNADSSNPFLINTNIDTAEVYNPGTRTATVTSPGTRTPGTRTPGTRTPGTRTPGTRTSAITASAPDEYYDIVDVTWTVTNEGNTTAAYSSLMNIDNPEQYEGSYAFQLIVSTGSSAGSFDGCEAQAIGQDQIIAVIPNPGTRTPSTRTPGTRTPGTRTASYFIPPADSATTSASAQAASTTTAATTSSDDGTLKAPLPPNSVSVTLRAYQLVPDPPVKFMPNLDPPSHAVLAQSCNSDGTCPDDSVSPDLVFSSAPTVSSTVVPAGGSLIVSSGSVTNQGYGPAQSEDGHFGYAAFLVTGPGPDTFFGTSDDLKAPDTVFLGSIGSTAGALQVGQSAAISGGTVTVPATVPAGDYTLLLMTDDQLEVSEVEEINNAIAMPFTVGSPNTAPTASDQSVTTPEDTAAAITLTASDGEGDSLTFSILSGPTHGTLTGTAPNLTYTPQANYFGPDSLTFRVNDGELDSNTATVSITVQSVNDVPVALNKSVATAEDTSVAFVLQATDVESSTLAYIVVSAPQHGTLSGTAPNLTYTPAPNYFGPDSFTFKANDGEADSNVATVSIAVATVNDSPIVTGDSVTIFENGGTVLIDVLANDADVDGTLTLVSVTQPANGTTAISSGKVAYTPAMNFAGIDTFTYTASDGTTTAIGTVTVTVDGGAPDYQFIGLQSPWAPGAVTKIGNSFPLVWQYALGGVVVNSSGAMPEVRIKGPFNCSQSETAATVEFVAYPGNSGFQYFDKTNTHQFNWKTDGLAVGCYNVRIYSEQTRQLNGPFMIRLRR